MSKIRNRNIILSSNEVIKFPNSQVSDTGSLEITGTVSIDATQIKGVEVDMTTLADEGYLSYDSTSGMLIFVGGIPPVPSSVRGIFAGGNTTGFVVTNVIQYIDINTPGNSQDFGDLYDAVYEPTATSNGSNDRGIIAGGQNSGFNELDTIGYITIGSLGNTTSFGTLSATNWKLASCSNKTNERGVFLGGDAASGYTDVIEYITINSTGNAQDFGDLSIAVSRNTGLSNGTNERGISGGGRDYNGLFYNDTDLIEYITINSAGNSQTFGDLLAVIDYFGSTSNGTNERGIFFGGGTGGDTDVIQYITINSTGNASDFGDLYTGALGNLDGCSNGTQERGVIGGGSDGNPTNYIQYVTINSTGNSQDFGDLYVPSYGLTGTAAA